MPNLRHLSVSAIRGRTFFALFVALLALTSRPATAQTPSFTIIHAFGDGTVPNDGANPDAPLMQAADGLVFKMTGSGVVTILHSFGDGSVANDGQYPDAGLVQASDGTLYGTTYGGGSAGYGTIFKITTSGQLSILHSFGDGSTAGDGLWPMSALMQGPYEFLIGTTPSGGSTAVGGSYGYGTIYMIDIQNNYVTILHSFGDGSVTNDGQNPFGYI